MKMETKKVVVFVDKTDVENINKVESLVSKILTKYPTFLLAEADSEQINSLKQAGFSLELRKKNEMIRLRTVEFDTSKESPQVPENLSLKSADLEEGENYWIVQFIGPIKEEWKTKITNLGSELYDYIPENAFLVKIDAETREKLQKLDFVNWIGPYEPLYKVSPLLMGSKEKVTGDELRTLSISKSFKPNFYGNLRLIVHDSADIGKVQQKIHELAGNVLEKTNNSIKASIQPSELLKLAKMSEVKWIEPVVVNKLVNDVAAQILDVQQIWNNHGLDGEGQIVAVCDSGIDTGVIDLSMHADFQGRIQNIYSWPIQGNYQQYLDNTSFDDGPADLGNGHGTHVTGSVLGNGEKSGGSIRGMAFNARLIFQAVEQWMDLKPEYTSPPDLIDSYQLLGIPNDLNELFRQAYNEGARIHNNSWGGSSDVYGNDISGQYTIDSQTIDDFIWNHKDMVIIFAAGNGGMDFSPRNGVVDSDSLDVQATAKNCITVGASENNRPHGTSPPPGYDLNYGAFGFPENPIKSDHVSNNSEGMAAFSSRGPTDDGRIKPDVVAPGTNILSTRSSLATEILWGHLPAGDPNRPFYTYSGGTSMAAPIVTGVMALIRQYIMDEFLHVFPTAALLKALLINGAHPMTGQYQSDPGKNDVGTIPDNNQGWGRVDLERALFPEYPVKLEFEDDIGDAVGSGESKEYDFTLVDGTVPLRATLVWTDHPSTPQAGGELVNTLRLSIIPPSGITVQGQPSNNNVQQAVISTPQTGVYKIKVEGLNIPHPKQDFALVFSGGLEFTDVYIKDNAQDDGIPPSTGCLSESPDIWVSLNDDPLVPPVSPEYGQTNYVFIRVHNRGNEEAKNAEVKLYWAYGGTNLSRQYWKADGIKVDGVVGNTRILDVPPRTAGNDGEAVTAAFEWLPPAPESNVRWPGHFCLFATVNHPDDPLLVDDIEFVRWEDNLAWKNVDEVDQIPDSTTGMDFYVAGLKDEAANADLHIDRSSLPPGGSVKLKIPTRYLQDSNLINLQKVWESEGHKVCKVEVTSLNTADINGIKLKLDENTLVRLEITLPENTVDGNVYPIFVEQKVNGTTTGRVTLVARTVKTPAYIANWRTGEIHYPNCDWVDKMSDKNKVPFNDLELAIQRGYNGCRFCLPKYSTD